MDIIEDTKMEFSDELIIDAIKNGKLRLVQWLQLTELQANEYFITAVQANKTNIVDYLLSMYDIRLGDCYCCIIAIENNNLEMLEMLVNDGANLKCYNNGCMKLAIKNNNHEIIKYLLKNGCSSCKPCDVVEHCDLDTFRLLFDDKELDISQLFKNLCKYNKLDIIKYVNEHHIANYSSTLFYASMYNRKEIVQYVLTLSESDADLAYIIAKQKRHADIVDMLKNLVNDGVILDIA